MKYPELVIEEATNLRKFTTPKEKESLDLEIDPLDPLQCIYGRISGSCYNNRATELIKKCCPRVYNKGNISLDTFNGSPIGKSRSEYWSPIELYINNMEIDSPEIRHLADFIQGKIETL